MKLTIEPSHILFDAPKALQVRLYEKYVFRDSSVEYQYARFQKRARWMETTGCWVRNKDFGGDKEKFILWRDTKLAELASKLDVHCCEWKGENLRLPIGLLDSLTAYLDCHLITFELQENRNFDLPKKKLVGFCPPFRPPQEDAIRAALLSPVGMIRMATGVGKTVVGQEIIRHLGHRAIFLVPSRSILHQTVKRFVSAFGSANVGKFGAGKKKHAYVTVATYQSVFAADGGEFDQYDVAICDEAHHIPADTYYEVVENKLKNAVYRYGLTADEERSDGGTILVEAATGPVVYSYDAPQAIADGYLAKPTFMIYEITRTEGTYIKWITDENGDRVNDGIEQSEGYAGEDGHVSYKNWVLGNDLLTRAICDLAAAFKEQGLSVLILVAEKEHGDKLMGNLRPKGAVFVTGDTEDNDKTLAAFNRRDLKLVIATSTWGEGTDTVPIDVLINLMGGTKTKQVNGRALRNDPDENGIPQKPRCMIIDFDVPASPVLHRHSQMREAVDKTCGPVHRSKFI